ncbi:MAG: hypothetical protein K2W96_10595 [Gemmataceae bacterium]|nr:hypothetical protein [Gemmataceae bacterium]
MALLFHGTTLIRACRIEAAGPDPDWIEPGGTTPAENFSACLPSGPFAASGRPESYACLKAAAVLRDGRDEGGPAILLMEVPDGIIALAVDEHMPLSQGFVRFDQGPALSALLAAWRGLRKRVIPFTE